MRTQSSWLLVVLLATACSSSPANVVSSSSGGWGTSTGTTGTNGTIDPGCGTVSEQGACTGAGGTVAEDCYTGDLDDGGTAIIEENCATVVSDGPELSCGTVSGDYLDFGVACQAASANPCAFEDQSGSLVLVPCAGDAGVGCVLQNTAQGSTCEGGFSPCTYFDDGGLPPPTCFNGTFLIVNCVYNQPTSVDCSTFGGTCSSASGQCVGLPQGSACGTALVCASGLICTPSDAGSSCQP